MKEDKVGFFWLCVLIAAIFAAQLFQIPFLSDGINEALSQIGQK